MPPHLISSIFPLDTIGNFVYNFLEMKNVRLRLNKTFFQLAAAIFLLLFLSGCGKEKLIIPPKLQGEESSGTWMSMTDCFKGPLTMLVHGGTWDMVTLEELKIINEIEKAYGSKGLTVIFLASGQPGRENLKIFKQMGDYNFLCFQDDDNFKEVFGKEETVPCIKLVDAKGVIQAKFIGFTTRDKIEPIVKRYLGEPLPTDSLPVEPSQDRN